MTQRLPLAKARVIGADLRNPSRYQSNLPTLAPVGDPPSWMTDQQQEAWRDFVDEIPWLARSHRALLEVASLLRARFISNPEVGVNTIQALSAVLSKLGATPVDEARVGWSEPEEPDQWFDN